MILGVTKNGSSMAPLQEDFEAPLFLRVHVFLVSLCRVVYGPVEEALTLSKRENCS